MMSDLANKKVVLLYFAFILLACIFLYAPVSVELADISFFHNDDHKLINRISELNGIIDTFKFIFNVDFHKFRPVANFQYLFEYYIFSDNYGLYIYYNIILISILAISILCLLKKMLPSASWVAYVGVLLVLVSSKYIIYSVWNITGSFETLAAIFFVAVVHYIFHPNLKRLIFFSICLILTSERFLPLLFILPVLYLYVNNNEGLFRITIRRIVLPFAVLLSYALIRLSLGLPIIVGTQTDNIAQSFTFSSFLYHILQSYIEILGFSFGPAYLTGFKFADWVPFTALVDNKPYFMQLVSFSILFIASLYAFILCIFLMKKKEIVLNIIAFALIAAASVTFRLELRWLLPAYISILLLWSSALLTTGENQFAVNLFKRSLFAIVIISALTANIIYALGARQSLYFAEKLHQSSILHHFFKFIYGGF